MSPTQRRWQVSACALALALGACSKAPAPPPASANQAPPPVSVAAAIEREVRESDEFPGRIEATDAVEVRARVNGYLQAVKFEPGALVRKGDLLIVIDPRPFQAALDQAEAALASTRAQLALARTELTRQEQLLKDRATAKREYDTAAAQVQSLEARAHADAATIATARLNLEYTHITAPISGRAGKDEVTVGNLIQGEVPNSPVLTTIVSQDPVYVSFEADERAYLKYIGPARNGQLEVAVGLADEKDFPHQAKLGFIDNRIDTASGTVRLRAVLDNSAGRFTPGLFARVKLNATAAPRRVVMVADRAIGTDQSKRFVLVVDDKHLAQYREVRIGRAERGLRVIEDGLKAGETIVVNGLQRARPGMPVTPQTVEMDGVPGGAPAEAPAAK
ncbi:MAG: efflux RND transporter periplasmic adaptor subunit [Gammaproteobacteria bacterium]|nr:efflux RND transporter periplasmic adaptor subunit [Gammaproteobacteria bacterium]